jgi:hypothetical protein
MPRHRRQRQRQPVKIYVIIFMVCGGLALLMHLISDVSDDVGEYADDRMNAVMRKAVESELQKAVK